MMATKKIAKVGKVMNEFKAGELHTGSKTGKVVKSRKQAIAIALSEAGMSKPMKKKMK
jgi:ribosomal protein L21E